MEMSEEARALPRDTRPQPVNTDNPNENIQALVESSVSRSIHSALHSAVTVLQDSISKSISMAISQSTTSNPKTPSDIFWSPETSVSKMATGFNPHKKAKAKKHHISMTSLPSKKHHKKVRQDDVDIDKPTTSHLISIPQSQPTPLAREEEQIIRAQKPAKRLKPDSFVELESDDSSDPHDDLSDESVYLSQESGEIFEDPDIQEVTAASEQDATYFDPSLIRHPRSGEWLPNSLVAQFMAIRINKALDRSTRNKMKAECPRPSLPHCSAITPELDPILNKFLMKTGKNPKKGIDRSFKSCQDKLLDLLGPLSKILDLVEESASSSKPIDIDVLRGWAQRAVCFLGNANTAITTERKRAVLMKIDPQLTNLASNEPPNPTEGMLFGEEFIQQMGKYVGMFSSITKAQSSLKKVFSNRVFTRAGKGRSRFSGRYVPTRQQRGSYHQYQPAQPSYPTQPQNPSPFFPYRARTWRPRGQRGIPRAKPSTAV
ncbi:uncharacterized protein LOC130274287 [Hyla sarda]|uniref:uncharacterized protein LOC130274287 n=1 Tax=Hyla sarda TaxID=327740 RepID=UPI0024C4336C|nr:uncharacterized protein LOC130274287 [Hyla sarda]